MVSGKSMFLPLNFVVKLKTALKKTVLKRINQMKKIHRIEITKKD